MAEEEALHALVNGNDDLEFKDDGSGKVRVKSTSHEIPPRLQLVKDYINGSKYKKARERASFDFSQYEPYITTREKNNKFLHCTLTGTALPMDPKKIQAHVNCKRYKELLKARQEKEAGEAAKLEKKKELREQRKAKAEAAKAEAEKATKPDTKGGAGEAAAKKKSKRKRASSAKEGADKKQVASDADKGKKKKRPLRSIKLMRKNQFADGKAEGAAPGEQSKGVGADVQKPAKKKLKRRQQ
mmetsp:Transcript_40522/g.101811  ORF Transcript_40522/g.101811 Transcript_40522/m.101811 type:complete len:242 (-) Transcript_40522:70-795(-)